VKRTAKQIIDDAGERQLRSIFEPLGWAVRKLDRDIGIDFSVEMFENFKSIGVIFKVQLKSSTLTKYSASKGFISQPLKLSNAQYLCNELRVPVLLVHADVKNARTYWGAPQLMIAELQPLLEAKDRKHVSLRVPTSNELPATIVKLVETVTQVEQVLASRLIISTPTGTYVRLIEKHIDQDQLTRELQDKADLLKLVRAHRLAQARRHAEAIEKAERVFRSDESSILSKFNALLTIESAQLMAAMINQEPQQNYHLIKLTTGRQLRKLTKKGPRVLKFHALVVWETAKLQRLTQTYHGLLLNWVAQKDRGNVTWRARLFFEKSSVYRKILAKYNQCIRLANYAARLRGGVAVPTLLMRIVDAMAHFIGNLESENHSALADQYSSSALQICKLAASIAIADKDDEGLFTVATKALMTKRAATGEAVDFALATMGEIRDEETKHRTQELVDRVIRSYQGERLEGPVKTTYRQVYENMATALGVNLSNPSDPASKLVEIGLADLDRSRVLTNCEHIFITFGTHGLVAELLDMPTAGHKILHCDLHEYAIQGLSLDGTYDSFKKQYCDNCADSCPRPSSWQYSDEWQQEENQKQKKYMERFAKRTGLTIQDGKR
jgi:uncharacterized protein DUF4365